MSYFTATSPQTRQKKFSSSSPPSYVAYDDDDDELWREKIEVSLFSQRRRRPLPRRKNHTWHEGGVVIGEAKKGLDDHVLISVSGKRVVS